MAAGSIVVDLLLRTGSFESDTQRAQKRLEGFGKAVDAGIAKGINAAAIGVTALVGAATAAVAVFQNLTEGAAKFKDLEETTGASAESLASFAVSAATAGVEVESIGGAMNRLTKNLVGVDDESKAAGAALASLGINVAEFKRLDPAAQYETVGKALAGFADGANKSAVAQALFGKSGTEQLRVFKALEEAGGRQTILTQRQIDLADAYADQQARSTATLKLYAQAAASEAIPALSDLTGVATALAREFLGVDAASGKLAANNGARTFAEGVVDAFAFAADQVVLTSRLFEASGKFIGAYAASAKALLSGNLSEAKAIGAAFREDLDEMDKRLTVRQRLANQRTTSAALALGQDPTELARRGRAPKVDARPALAYRGAAKKDGGAGTSADAAEAEAARLLRKQLDARISAIRDFAEEQRDAFEFANAYVRGTYDDGLTDLRQFHQAEKQIRDAALAATLSALDQEATALRDAMSKGGRESDQVDMQKRLAEVIARRGQVAQKAGRDGILAGQEEARSIKALQDRYDDLRATILQLSGDTAGASRIRIAQQVAEAQKLAAQTPGGSGVDVDAYRRGLEGAEALNEAQREYGRLVERARNAEESAFLDAQAAGAGELETLAALGAKRREALADLDAMVRKANELAITTIANGGNAEAAIANAERMGLAYKNALAEIDPLAKKINTMLADSFADSFASFIDGTMSAKDAFKSFANDIFAQMTRLAAQKIAGDIFGGGTAAGGASGSGGWGSVVGTAISAWFGGGKASGGPTRPGMVYQVAERGPEVYSEGGRQYLLTGARTGNVTPNHALQGAGRSVVVNNHFTVSGNVDRRTQGQIAGEAARALAAANARFN